MFLLSALIMFVVLALITNAAYAAVFRKRDSQKVTRLELTPEARLKRVYLGAYFSHRSMSDELWRDK